MAEGGGIRRQALPKKLTMECYLDFIHSQKELDLTVPHLNQTYRFLTTLIFQFPCTKIIDMHGFRKMPKTYKGDLMEAVKTMELMDPSRSTLGDSDISSDAFISLDDLIKDVKELQWQECCITSLQTINAVDHDELQHEISNNQTTTLAMVGSASTPSEKPRRPRKKFKKLFNIGPDVGCGNPASSTSFDFGGSQSQSTSCTPLVMKLVPNNKRGVKRINRNQNDNHGDGDLGGSAMSVTDSQPLEGSSSAFLLIG